MESSKSESPEYPPLFKALRQVRREVRGPRGEGDLRRSVPPPVRAVNSIEQSPFRSSGTVPAPPLLRSLFAHGILPADDTRF